MQSNMHYVVQRWNGGLRDDYEITVSGSFDHFIDAVTWCKTQPPVIYCRRVVPVSRAYTILAFNGGTPFGEWNGEGGSTKKKEIYHDED